MNLSLHLADVLTQHLPTYRKTYGLSAQQRQVCQHIATCRTAILGHQTWHCNQCEHEKVIYGACRDRYCPRCQGQATQDWISKQAAHLIDCRYYHVVFTLPHELNGASQQSAKAVYQSLFEGAWQTLSQFAHNKKSLQGQLGMTAVLHTWGQNLSKHIHLHCLVPGGVLTKGHAWHRVKGDYLFPVKALSTVFRAKTLNALRAHKVAISENETLMNKPWCVYSKACLSKPEMVLRYLGRYTRKGVFQEKRLQRITDDSVSFRYRDYRADKENQPSSKIMTLAGTEFIRRYLQHVLPKGLMRVRHFGFLANACRAKKLAVIQKQVNRASVSDKLAENAKVVAIQPLTWPCKKCKTGVMQPVGLMQASIFNVAQVPLVITH